MNHIPSDGHDQYTHNPEKIKIIGRPMPSLEAVYDNLSTTPDIRVMTEAPSSIQQGRMRRDVSEKELIDNLIEFVSRVRDVPLENLNDHEQRIVESADMFINSMHFLSHEAYQEAVDGLARHHAEWLQEDESRKLRVVVQRNRQHSSQWAIANDLGASIVATMPELENRVDVTLIGNLTKGLTNDTKLVLVDDWSVSGNLIAQDLAHVYQVFDRDDVSANVEIDLLVARENQVQEGIHTIDTTRESFVGNKTPELYAYFQAPADEGVFGYKPVPTGSHSSVDYGFSETLDAMRDVLARHTPKEDVYMPYAAKIVPTYAYNYDN